MNSGSRVFGSYDGMAGRSVRVGAGILILYELLSNGSQVQGQATIKILTLHGVCTPFSLVLQCTALHSP